MSDAPQSKRTQGVELALVRAAARAPLSYLHGRHQAGVSATGAGSFGCSAFPPSRPAPLATVFSGAVSPPAMEPADSEGCSPSAAGSAAPFAGRSVHPSTFALD